MRVPRFPRFPRFRRNTLFAALITACASAPVAAAEQKIAVQTLADQARFWQSKGRGDLAAEAWQKLLLADPNNADALQGLASVELDAGRGDSARRFLARLRQLNPSHPALGRLEQSAQSSAVDRNQLERARRLAQSGNYDEAANLYRGLFAGRAPTGELALEYYLTLGGSNAYWEDARRGLEPLARAESDRGPVALAYAQVLTYREYTRREGIRSLARIAKQPGAQAAPALDAWRRALGWLDAAPGDEALFRDYLAVRPDEGVRQRLADIGRDRGGAIHRDPRDLAQERRDRIVGQGFDQIELNQIDRAEATFSRALTERPQDLDAKGGMGVVRLRQQRFREARELLQQASGQGNEAKWRGALNTATYWTMVEDAAVARKTVDTATAKLALQRAIPLDPNQTAAEAQLADILLEEGDAPGAERIYRGVLTRSPRSTDALRGLYTSLAAQGRTDEALRLAGRMPPAELQKLGGLNGLKVLGLREDARRAEAAGDPAAARVALEAALKIDASHPWVRYDLAHQHAAGGRAGEARKIAESLRAGDRPGAESLHAAALAYADLGEWREGLQALERVVPAERTAAMAALQRRMWVSAQTTEVSRLAREGRADEARRVATQMEAAAGRDPELAMAAALAYADAGDTSRALALGRPAAAALGASAAGVRLRYAALLLKAGEATEAGTVLAQLGGDRLTAAERRDWEALSVAQAVGRADALRGTDPARARAALAPALAARPNDTAVQLAAARVHDSAGERAEALALYRGVLAREPANADARSGALNAAVAVNDVGYARTAIGDALKAAPDDPQVLAAAARFARSQGDYARAADYYRAAIAAEQRAAGAAAKTIAPALAPRSEAAPDVLAPLVFAQVSGATMTDAAPIGAGMIQLAQANVPAPWTGTPPAQSAPAPAAPPVSLPPQFSVQSVTGQMAGSTPIYIFVVVPNAGMQTPPVLPIPVVPGPNGVPQVLQGVPIAMPPQFAPAAPATLTAPAPVVAAPAAAPVAPVTAPMAASAAPAPIVAQTTLTPAEVRGGGVSDLARELAELESRRGSAVGGGLNVRSRRGEAGRSELLEIEAPVEARIGIGFDRYVALRAAAVSLDAGRVNNGNPNDHIRFGSNALGGSVANGAQSDSGLGLDVAYESDWLRADVGSTPIGFRVRNTVGGVRLQTPGSTPGKLFGEISRRAVTDSLLAYAGARDDRTGSTWGGVTSTGGRLGYNWDERRFGSYLSASYHRVDGDNVADNKRVGASGGFYVRVFDRPMNAVTVGADVSWFRYEHNLRYFSLGHGGYFSPQRYTALTVPVDWVGRLDQLSYQVRASVGLQSFRESDAAWFPNDSGLQASLAATPGAATQYGGQTKTGAVFGLLGSVEYQAAPQFFVGGLVGFDNSKDYRQYLGGVYLRFALSRDAARLALPPRGYRLMPGY